MFLKDSCKITDTDETLYNCLPWDRRNRNRETGKRDHISLSFEMTLTLEDAILPGENRNKNKEKDGIIFQDQ